MQTTLSPSLSRVDFSDEHRQVVEDAPLQELVIRFLSRAPSWVRGAMKIRDSLVRGLGLKTSPAGQPPTRLVAGTRSGPFMIISVSDDEVIAGLDDRHLDFRVSFTKESREHALVVRTDVRFNSWLGKIYFVPVRIGHPLIVASMLRRAVPAVLTA